jgi:hypothetical protein
MMMDHLQLMQVNGLSLTSTISSLLTIKLLVCSTSDPTSLQHPLLLNVVLLMDTLFAYTHGLILP